MDKKMSDSINGYGAILRFITPVLLAALGFFMIRGINDIDTKIEKLDIHFSNHLSHHQDLEIGYERRLVSIESSQFTEKDAKELEIRIEDKINKLRK